VLTAKESKIADAGNTNPGITKKPSGGYCLTLDSVQGKKFAVAKVVMEITGLDLADAKDAADEAPIMLSQSLTKEKADQFQKQLETAGAKATVRKVE
jgi:ribosomal protein L7/L12